MPKHSGSLLQGDTPVFQGTIELEEADEPTHKPMGFRAPPPASPKLTFSLLFESLPTFKKGDILHLKLANEKEADFLVERIVEIVPGLYKALFISKSALK